MNKAAQVPALDKAIRILIELAGNEGAVTSSGLARKLGVSQPTCYRILKTLEATDWIRPNERKGYDLSMGLLPLAKPFVDLDWQGRKVQPVLEDLANDLTLTAKFSVRQGREQVTIATAEPLRPFGISAPVGARFPVVLGASGAVLLCELPEKELEDLIEGFPDVEWDSDNVSELRSRIRSVRENGACENLGMHPQGIDTVSAGVGGISQPAAITLVGLRGDIHEGNVAAIKERLLMAARDAGQRLHANL